MKLKKAAGYFLTGLLFVAIFILSTTASYLLLDIMKPSLIIPSTTNIMSYLPKAYIVQSGSMEPAIKTGSIVISYPSQIYSVGDVITFARNGSFKNLVTHRIEAKLFPNGIDQSPTYLTSGDANEDLDTGQVKQEQVVGKVNLIIPYFGYIANFAKQPYGFLLLVIVPATIIIYEELKSVLKEIGKELKKLLSKFMNRSEVQEGLPAQPGRTIFFKKLSVILPVFGAFLVFVGLASSFFADKEESKENVLQASAWTSPTPTPIPTPGAGDVVINEVNWAGSNGDGLDEWVELRNTTTNPINLAGWVVENLGTGSGPGANITIPSGVIPASGFFIISEHDKAGSRINIDPDFVTTSISLVNGGEQLVLKDNTAVTIDTANGTGAWFQGSNSTPKKSMERKSPPLDGTQSLNWQTATTHTNMNGSGPTDEFGSPGVANP